ncbi:AI-2E family transporter [Endozoicomonas sp. OPT23]|uniref:AI-2E family transporter n=1 Tax=Endozoicomonas sp. OPT23 TaxID=2072845 RepID=UPI00129A4FE6|nr:AI-2E family transporter [Endozoicomonas sp. OPT23]MRI35349.1 AI-2E family transporter [Endozoicomonas sp. OPT23]
MTRQQQWMLAGIVLLGVVLIHFVGAVMTPFAISMVLAYLGDPLVDRLEKMKLSRGLSVTIVFAVFFSVVALLLLVLIPALFHQLKALMQLLPALDHWFRDNVIPLLVEYTDVEPEWFDISQVLKNMASEWQRAGGLLAQLGKSVTSSGLAIVGFFVNLFLIPVVAFYLLRDWDIMMEHIRLILPVNIEPIVVELAAECDEVLGAFLKGQLMVMLALGVIYGLGLWFVGLQFALLIGLLAGLVSIIPYMGFVVGFTTAILVAFFQFDSYIPLLMVMGVFTVGQILESWVLTPYLVGDRIGLHPVAVIFALMAGGQIMGFVGMLIALPLAAIIMVLLRHLHRNYKASHLYHAGKPGE